MGLFDRFSKKDAATSTSGEADEPATRGTPPAQEENLGFFGKLHQGLTKTKAILNTDIRDLFKDSGRLVDDEFLAELFAILVKTDMGSGPAGLIRDRLHKDFRARRVQMTELLDVVKESIKEQLQQPESPIEFAQSGPTVIMVVGVNGSGKTTSIAKLAQMFTKDGKRVILGAGDTFRAAAVEQLSIWADRTGVEIVKGDQGCDPASVAHRTVSAALESNADLCILDTAGRLQTQVNLMSELDKIRRVIQKQVPEAPHEVLLVLDATAGQNGISQAKGFSDAAHCTGIVLAKLDGSAKGGVVIPIRQHFDLPVKYIGLGETADDLALFNADSFADALFDEFD